MLGRSWSGKHASLAAAAIGLLAVLALYVWPMLRFRVPLGYDAGMYRYLFLRHAEGFPPFILADLPPWAQGHPLGLFFFTSLLLRLHVPVDWLVGWIWNLVPVALVVSLTWIAKRRYGMSVAVWVPVAALLSAALFDGFAAMYWKTLASLFWCVWAFYALERRSLWAVLLGILTVVTHHQTGLLFGATLLVWAVILLLRGGLDRRMAVVLLGGGAVVCAIGLLLYLPVWEYAVMPHLARLWSHGDVPAGNFPSAVFYARITPFVLLLGLYGLVRSLRTERGSLWQIAWLISALFVCLRLFFYRRFYLQLDVFLVLFVALALADLWKRFPSVLQRSALLLLVAVQMVVTVRSDAMRTPLVDDVTFDQIRLLEQRLPADATVLSFENQTVMYLRGWLPTHTVGGPGLFDSDWSFEQWESFLLGTNEQRAALIATLPQPTYAFIGPFFRSFYGEQAEIILSDPCIQIVDPPGLYRLSCPAS